MMWHWLINGLGGMVSMMAAHYGVSQETISQADADKMEKHIRDLTAILATSRGTQTQGE